MPPVAVASLALLALWLAAALSRAVVRRALVDGLRCVGRYPDFWRLPAFLGLAYALFQIGAAALLHARMHEEFEVVAAQSAPAWSALFLAGWLPAAERAAAVFTVFTATFPLSAWFGLLFVLNFGGLLTELTRALRRRLGAPRAFLLALALFVAALAAIAKPAAYLLLPEIADHAPVWVPLGINLLSTVFELLLGLFFLTYLMLMAHAWRRGLHFERINLRLLAMRRTGFVIRWSLLLLAVALVTVVAPSYLGLLIAPEDPLAAGCAWVAAWIGRPLFLAFAFVFLATPAILVFHNEPLRPALREARRFFSRHALSMSAFLAAVYLPFLAGDVAANYALSRLGGETLAGLGVRVLAAFGEALLAGWLIASWVCLYKSLSAGRKEIPF